MARVLEYTLALCIFENIANLLLNCVPTTLVLITNTFLPISSVDPVILARYMNFRFEEGGNAFPASSFLFSFGRLRRSKEDVLCIAGSAPRLPLLYKCFFEIPKLLKRVFHRPSCSISKQ